MEDCNDSVGWIDRSFSGPGTHSHEEPGTNPVWSPQGKESQGKSPISPVSGEASFCCWKSCWRCTLSALGSGGHILHSRETCPAQRCAKCSAISFDSTFGMTCSQESSAPLAGKPAASNVGWASSMRGRTVIRRMLQ